MPTQLKEREKRVFLETFGCQMNENDSSRLLGLLRDISYVRTEDPRSADLILINTCSIRDKAQQKVYSTLGRFKTLKSENPDLVIGVSGCVAQQEGQALLKRIPYLDIVIGPHNIHKVKDILSRVLTNKSRVAATELYDGIDEFEYGVNTASGGVKALVSIMRGCDNFCAYCIVPYTRGREVSRPSGEIIKEISNLAASGVKEVTLLGQNVNSYALKVKNAGDYVSFAELLRMVSGVEGIERVRFVTSHPKDISIELMGLFKDEPKLCRHLHLPVQSGSDKVLKRMRRGYTRQDYLSKVSYLKALYPDMSVTTDIIVGFPGEADEDFADTMDLIKTVRFDNIFSFMYSARPNTAAAEFSGQLPLALKSGRLKLLQETQREITAEKNRSLIGQTLPVLIEGASKADSFEFSGRTQCNRIVNFPARHAKGIGSLINVSITDAYPNSLRGIYEERGDLCS